MRDARSRDDFGPNELTNEARAWLDGWAGDGEDRCQRWLVAVAALGNQVAETESLRSIADRVGVDKNTVKRWSEHVTRRLRIVREFGTVVLVQDVAREIERTMGQQAATRFQIEVENATPLYETHARGRFVAPPAEPEDGSWDGEGLDVQDDEDGSWDDDDEVEPEDAGPVVRLGPRAAAVVGAMETSG